MNCLKLSSAILDKTILKLNKASSSSSLTMIILNRKSSSIRIIRKSSYNTIKRNSCNQQQTRSITDQSWAAEKLAKRGEKIEKVPPPPDIFVTAETITSNHSDHVKQLTDDILSLNLVEVNQLWKLLQARLGIVNSGVRSASKGAGSLGEANNNTGKDAPKAAEAPKEKEAFDIKLGAVDAKAKIKIIKEVRVITGLGLKEAKELVEKAPCVIKPGVKKDEAEAFKKLLVDAGAVVTLE